MFNSKRCDSDIVVAAIEQIGVRKFIDDIVKVNQPVISAITEIELLCWKAATEKDVELLSSFINDAIVIELEQPIKIKTAEMRKLNFEFEI